MVNCSPKRYIPRITFIPSQEKAKKGDLSRFVNEAILSHLFKLTVDDLLNVRNQIYAQEDILKAIEDALISE